MCPRQKKGFVYIMTNKRNNVLYIGVTSNLYRRTKEHKSGEIPGFTQRYRCHKLVYYEQYDFIKEAILREKRLKKWERKWKNELIDKMNPGWEDLFESVGIL